LAAFTAIDSSSPLAVRSVAPTVPVARVVKQQPKIDEIRYCPVIAAGVVTSAVCRRRATARHHGSRLLLRADSANDDATEDAEEAAAAKPRSTKSRKKVAPFDPAAQVGVTEPLGFFDPLGFCPAGDPGNYRNLRAAELKHGRVAMMATVGFVAQHFFRIPGFEEAPPGIKAIEPIASESGMNIVPSVYGFWFVVAVASIFEYSLWRQDINREPGDFGDPLGLGMYDEGMRNRELNNGRFAMFAAVGIIAAELATGRDAIQQFGF